MCPSVPSQGATSRKWWSPESFPAPSSCWWRPSRRGASTSARSSTSTGGSSKTRDRGAAVLLVSSELDEVMALGDQIAVMYRGRIVGVVPPSVSRERIGLMMAGIEEGTALTAPTEEAR